jgi:hypothetical protein
MTRPMEPLPPYHLLDDHDTRRALTRELMLAIRVSAKAHGLARIDALAAVLPGTERTRSEPGLHILPGGVSSTWLIDHGCLDDFVHDPALRMCLQRGVPVITVFEHRDDYFALWSALPTDDGAVR